MALCIILFIIYVLYDEGIIGIECEWEHAHEIVWKLCCFYLYLHIFFIMHMDMAEFCWLDEA